MSCKMLLCIVIASVICAAGVARADTYVAQAGQTPDSGGLYTSWATAASNIQEAVNAAAEGDTVWVAPGTYTLPPNPTNYADSANVVYLNKIVTLRSSNGVPETTIIDGEGAYRGIAVNRAAGSGLQFVLDGLTIRDGMASNKGGGLLLDPNTKQWDAVVRNCVIRDNTAFGTNGTVFGGGIAGHSTSGFGLIVSNCVVENNLATNTLADTTKNYPSRGGGIYLSTSGQKQITGCTIAGNVANSGGGAYVSSGVVIEDSTIRDNHCYGTANINRGGGAFEFPNGFPFTLRNCLIYNNSAAYAGGAIFKMGSTSYTSHTYVASCTIVSNTAGYAATGMIRVRRNGALHLDNSIVYDSTINVTMSVSTFTNNWVYDQGVINGVNGTGNITNGVGPYFVDLGNGDLHLTLDSPCVNAGLNLPWMDGAVDLDGNRRIDGAFGVVDMGCYEYVYHGSTITIR